MKTHSQIWIQNGNEINTSTKNGANRNNPGSEIWQQEKSEIRYLWSSTTCEGYFCICADFRNIEVHVQKSRNLWFVKESIDQSLTLILTFLMEVILKPTLCFQLIDMHSKFYYIWWLWNSQSPWLQMWNSQNWLDEHSLGIPFSHTRSAQVWFWCSTRTIDKLYEKTRKPRA